MLFKTDKHLTRRGDLDNTLLELSISLLVTCPMATGQLPSCGFYLLSCSILLKCWLHSLHLGQFAGQIMYLKLRCMVGILQIIIRVYATNTTYMSIRLNKKQVVFW